MQFINQLSPCFPQLVLKNSIQYSCGCRCPFTWASKVLYKIHTLTLQMSLWVSFQKIQAMRRKSPVYFKSYKSFFVSISLSEGQFSTDICHLAGDRNVVTDVFSRIGSVESQLDHTRLAAD